MFDRTSTHGKPVKLLNIIMLPPFTSTKTKGLDSQSQPTRYFSTPTQLKSSIKLRQGSQLPRLLSFLLLWCGLPLLLIAQNPNLASLEDEPADIQAFAEYFEPANVGNLHIWAATTTRPDLNYPFRGEQLPRGLYGLFAANWSEELPADFDTYAVYTIKHGARDAYILRFAGPDTYNMIGLFRLGTDDKLHHLRTLATYHCGDGLCIQTDSWLQDFDGDTRIDILQKSRVMQYTLLNRPTDEYQQVLLQQKDGTYISTRQHDIDLRDYDLKTDSDSK